MMRQHGSGAGSAPTPDDLIELTKAVTAVEGLTERVSGLAAVLGDAIFRAPRSELRNDSREPDSLPSSVELLGTVLAGLAWNIEHLAEQIDSARAAGATRLDALAARLDQVVDEHTTDQQLVIDCIAAINTRLEAGIAVSCDACSRPARRYGTTHRWHSRAAAISDLSGPTWGWSATSELLVCARCLAQRICERTGHDWSGWQDLGPDERQAIGDARDPDLQDWSLRNCYRCRVQEVGWAGPLGPRVHIPGRL